MFSQQALDAFQRDGFTVAPALAPAAECGRILRLAKADLAAATGPVEYEADVRYPGAPASHDATGGRTVRRLLQAYSRASAFARWALSAELGKRLPQLLGPGVQLSQAHHNCVMTKDPRFSSSTGWHRDVRYWSFERPELVSVWLALGRELRENGCLLVLPGSHAMEFSSAQLDAEQFLRTDVKENEQLLARSTPIELEPGDTLFFDARLIHAAGRNHTQETKYSVVFTYHAAANRPLPGTRSSALPDIELRT